jgi:hypothetical protein
MPTITKIIGKTSIRYRVQIKQAGLKSYARTFSTDVEACDWAAQEQRRIEVLRHNIADSNRTKPTPYKVAGVYVLYRGTEVRYVGRSVSIYRRLNDHDRKAMDWDGFLIWPCGDSAKAADLEHELIRKYNPPLNRQMLVPRGTTSCIPLTGRGLASPTVTADNAATLPADQTGRTQQMGAHPTGIMGVVNEKLPAA